VIDFISTEDLQHLAEVSDRYCVSIYLPTHPAGSEATQNPIRLKNLLATARTELQSLGLSHREADDLLAPIDALRRDPEFWTGLGNGLAVLFTNTGSWTYRLPTSVKELAVVAESFHLKPLLSSVTADEVFYLLALAQSEVRLLRGGRFDVSEVSLGTIPASLAEAVPFDERESTLQSHGGGRSGRGGVVAVFHGHGGGKDAKQIDVDRFLTAVDHGFRETVGPTTAPLVLAGVEHLVSHFRKLSSYPHIVDDEIRGNPEHMGVDELHRRAWPAVEPLLDAAQRTALAAVAAASVPTLGSLAQIVVRAADGRIDSLIVPLGVQRWGTFHRESRVAVEHDTRRPGDRDLLDIAAIETLTHGGRVYVVPRSELPPHMPVAATVRY
jgi:hypothetical protein